MKLFFTLIHEVFHSHLWIKPIQHKFEAGNTERNKLIHGGKAHVHLKNSCAYFKTSWTSSHFLTLFFRIRHWGRLSLSIDSIITNTLSWPRGWNIMDHSYSRDPTTLTSPTNVLPSVIIQSEIKPEGGLNKITMAADGLISDSRKIFFFPAVIWIIKHWRAD